MLSTDKYPTPEEWAAMCEARSAWRAEQWARTKIRKEQARIRENLIAAVNDKFDEGFCSEEIGEALGIPGRKVRRISNSRRIANLKAHQRQFRFTCQNRYAIGIRKLADRAGVSPAEMIERMIEALLADGIDRAARTLGKAALPKRAKLAAK